LECDLKTTGLPVAAAALFRRGSGRARTSKEGAEAVRSWLGLLRPISGVHVLALADQVAVSAASFLTTVIIGRCTDPSQLGAYAIGISILASAYTMQGSLITLPYSIQLHRPLGTPAEHAGSALANSGLFSALATLVLAVAAVGLSATGAQPELLAMTWALAGVMPFALIREFARRFAFSHLQMAEALMLDVAVAVIQLSILGWLAWTGQMSAVTASGAIGVSCGVAAVGWLYVARAEFSIRRDDVSATMKQSWDLGKWLFVNQIMVQVQRYITYWLSAVMAGAAITGIYAACMSVVSFANPLVFGLFNILAPRSALAWKEGGGPVLRRQAIQDSLLFIAVMAPFCVLVLFAGEDVMRFLYPGAEYEGHGHTVTVLALATLASAAGTPASNALASMEKPRTIVGVGGIGAAFTVLLVWLLMTKWGLLGAAYGLLSGNAVSSAGLWAAFLALVPRARDPASALQVLHELTQTSDSDRWAITRLGEGDHATVYAVQCTDRHPIFRTYDNLVIKLYKPEAALSSDLVDAQFDSLSRLHAALDGRTVNGWKISTPKPIHVSRSPPALVMTAVAATKDLKSCAAADDDLTPELLDSLGRAFTAAMHECWSRGQLHGDLALQNILYDIPGKNLSLIDPGTRECCRVCNDLTQGWSPAVLELGHILRDLGTDVRDMIGNPIARLRRQIFAESALRAFLETIGPFAEKRRTLDEIQACARYHLSQVLDLSWSLRGIWNWLLTQLVVRRMDSMLDRLKAELDTRDKSFERSTALRSDRERAEA
jgi:O-antigen/teichoic acid export membrane protein/tRNA A-37 threonylcarbamoyl transferase component Bud32